MACLFVVALLSTPAPAQESTASDRNAEFSAADVAAAQQFTQTIGVADWLGPLAPVALSPFFAIACLSGMALYGGDWVSADNAFLGENSPLNNPVVFWTFLILTLITSIPRFTKVSKPFAQAVDQIEAWAGIITLVALKIMMGLDAPDAEQFPAVQLGFVSFTADTLLIIAAVVNIIVINTVKFFFEILIWITPIPTIDALFEVANKTVCGALMAIYGFSPTIATVINLAIFGISAVLFSWIYRREVFFRTALLDAVWGFFAPPKRISHPELTVFPTANFGPVPARSRCRFRKTDSGWVLVRQRLLRSDVQVEIDSNDHSAELAAGYFTNSIILSGSQPVSLSFSRWYSSHLPELASQFGAQLRQQEAEVARDRSELKAELS